MAESNEAGIWFIPFSGTSTGNMTMQSGTRYEHDIHPDSSAAVIVRLSIITKNTKSVLPIYPPSMLNRSFNVRVITP